MEMHIEKKNGLREKLIEDLEHHEEYIQVFSTDEQIKIVGDMVSQIKQREFIAFRVSWMLPYLANRVLNEILTNADKPGTIVLLVLDRCHETFQTVELFAGAAGNGGNGRTLRFYHADGGYPPHRRL